MDFQQSRTYSNIDSAYRSESIVHTLYQIYGDRARVDGFEEIGNIFDTIARNEKEHARIFYRLLNGGLVPDTQQNLLRSSELETSKADEYRVFAQTALEEGYDDIAALFNGIANIELNHDLQFRSLHENVVRDQVFCKPTETLWICIECGNIMSGPCAPEVCPVCQFPQGFYRVYQGVSE
ncbi:MAG TPA: rubrerythrin family protein [Clostridiales bacterium]|nr:rubrerythrin family protein [Clostridiales bacterium]